MKYGNCILGRTFNISISISYRNKDANKEKNKYCIFNDLLLSPKPQLFLQLGPQKKESTWPFQDGKLLHSDLLHPNSVQC